MITNTTPILRFARQTNSHIFTAQKRNAFYEKYKHGPQKISNPDPPYRKWLKELLTKEGRSQWGRELSEVLREPFKIEFLKRVHPNELHIIEDFDSDAAIKRWRPVADSDSLNGFSQSNIIRSPAGHALFTGILDTRLPDDGMTQLSGFAGIIGPPARRTSIFNVEPVHNWRKFNCLEIKFRGDGRKYAVVINTGSYYNDLTYYDTYMFPMYTRGGPYWQTLRIPFHKFIFSHKGCIQDSQNYLPNYKVKFVAITIQDSVDGPFSLEIDHIGLIFETKPTLIPTAYETYTFSHLKFKPIQPECGPPESSP